MKGFFRRQIQSEATSNQKIFDWVFGIILPIICFYFDPIVFKGGIWEIGDPIFADYRAFAYLLSITSILSLFTFMIWGKKLKWLNSFLSGLLIISAIISLSIGIMIFPISLLGLFVLVGAMGFTPLFTSFVYLRNGIRAFEDAQPFFSFSMAVRSAVLSAVLSLAVPYLANAKMQYALETMLNGDANRVQQMGKKFKYVAPLVNTSALVRQYRIEQDYSEEKRKAIANLYQELSGEDIEQAINVMND